MRLIYRPIERWPTATTPAGQRIRAPFKVGFDRTVNDIKRELTHLATATAIIQLDLPEGRIRNDGLPYATATPASPRVIVSAETRWGWRHWPCDRFTAWQGNLRAIGLTLERLRLVDLYGVTQSGEQYRGFLALPAPEDGLPQIHTAEEAAAWLIDSAGGGYAVAELINHADRVQEVWKQAAMNTHPDRGGKPGHFERCRVALEVLNRHHVGRAA